MYLVQVRRQRLPLRAAVRTAHGVMTERDVVLVRLEDMATARAGLGEAAPLLGFSAETADGIVAALRALGEKVTGEQLAAVAAHGGCVGFAIEAALAEIGRTDGESKSKKKGDHAGADAPVFRRPAASWSDTILPVAALLPAGRRALEKIPALGEAGFRTFKWKVGVAPAGEELPLLDDVCAALPPGARLRLDANGAWDRRTAERWLARCAECPVELVEQPCPAPSVGASVAERARAEDLLCGLADDFPVRIALDESLAGPGDVEHWLAAGWGGVWVVKPALFGGAALARLRAAGADLVFSSALETAVGAKAALRAAFAHSIFNLQRPTPTERAADGRESAAKPGVPPANPNAQNPRPEPGRDAPATPPRALGFGVWPLFADARFDGPFAAPFLRGRDVEAINPEAVWNALS
jgi:O-succinylbenzoate synthase